MKPNRWYSHPLVNRTKTASAFIKSVRLKRNEDALYWASVFLQGGAGRWYVARRLFISAAEDNLDLSLIEEADRLLDGPQDDFESIYRLTYKLSHSEKLWSVEAGQELVFIWAEIEGRTDHKGFSDGQLFGHLSGAIDEKDFKRAAMILNEVLSRKRLYSGMLALLYRRLRGTEAEQIAEVALKRKQILASYLGGDGNYPCLLLAFLIRGVFGQGYEFDEQDFEEKKVRAVEEAATGFQQGKLREVPSWALDGIHTVGRDKRFTGTWLGFKNMCLMYRQYGRLDPRDPGIID